MEAENNENISTTKKRKNTGLSILSGLISLILIICIGLFAYKKAAIDYDGKYATDRITYTEEYGFCLLITYHPSYQKGNAKGYAITHIPTHSLFSKTLRAQKDGNDTADSEEMLESYQLLATWGDNSLADKLFSTSDFSTKSFEIPDHGKYFILNAKSIGL